MWTQCFLLIGVSNESRSDCCLTDFLMGNRCRLAVVAVPECYGQAGGCAGMLWASRGCAEMSWASRRLCRLLIQTFNHFLYGFYTSRADTFLGDFAVFHDDQSRNRHDVILMRQLAFRFDIDF